jgi:ABC-type glutathione transport system ATPase component
LSDGSALLEVRDLRKVFTRRGSDRQRSELVALDDVSFTLARERSLAIVGESGSGKTTVARLIIGLERATRGTITVLGEDRSRPAVRTAERRRRGRQVQIVFQDPYSSLDPSQCIGECVDEVLRLHFELSRSDRRRRTNELLEQVGLGERDGRALPRSLSGGQRQRAAIARALAAEPTILILDEAVAALDVSIQAQVLNRLADVRDETGMTYIFISHDLSVVRQLTQEAIVMQQGRIVEQGPTARVLDAPEHEYTKLLRESVPVPGWKPKRAWLEPESGPSNHADHGAGQ